MMAHTATTAVLPGKPMTLTHAIVMARAMPWTMSLAAVRTNKSTEILPAMKTRTNIVVMETLVGIKLRGGRKGRGVIPLMRHFTFDFIFIR